MMTWRRAFGDRKCGSCPATIAAGKVYLEIRPANTTATLLRCGSCGVMMSGQAVPLTVDEDRDVVPQPSLPIAAAPKTTQNFVRIGHGGKPRAVTDALARAERDFRERQTGERNG